MIISGLLLLDSETAPRPGWIGLENGRIAEIGQGRPPEAPRVGGDDRIVCPAFVDAHIHLPQFDAIGCEHDDLLTWLEQVIFPAETRWADARFAREQAAAAYRRMLRAGTLAYAGYLTSHPTGPIAVAEAAAAYPLRALVGQVLMDRDAPPSLLGHAIADTDGIEATETSWSVNPRFALSCSAAMLGRAGEVSGGRRFVQTHLAESKRECERVGALFPDAASYAAVYDDAGLLHERTLLAHCLHLSDIEWRLIADRGAAVIHCPGANTFLRSGAFNLAAARAHGVRIGLGSDVAAGPDVSMPRVARAMIEVAKMQAMLADGHAPVPTPAETWTMITRGNADLCGWPDVGRLEIGAAASLLVLRAPPEIDEHLIGRLLYTWRDDHIEHRIVNGELC